MVPLARNSFSISGTLPVPDIIVAQLAKKYRKNYQNTIIRIEHGYYNFDDLFIWKEARNDLKNMQQWFEKFRINFNFPLLDTDNFENLRGKNYKRNPNFSYKENNF